MIPLLLWRCPLCATNDALAHTSRRFRADRVQCRRCGAEWHVRRVPGDNFYMRLVRVGSGDARGALCAGDERTIADWYDMMKATVCLSPIHDPTLPLNPDEVLYLASGPAELWAEETDPLFFLGPDSPAAPATSVDRSRLQARLAGRGRMFLTDSRLAWQGDGQTHSFPLHRLNSAHALMDHGLVLMVEMRIYSARFFQESLLKWVTHVALVAVGVETKTGHRIATSRF